jgi:hypothetical protein
LPYPSNIDQNDRAQGNLAQVGLQTLTGTLTLTLAEYNCNFLKLDPGGAARTVLLWPELDCKGAMVFIVNAADAAENLTVKEDSNTTTIVTINQNEGAWVWSDGTSWNLLCVQTIALS